MDWFYGRGEGLDRYVKPFKTKESVAEIFVPGDLEAERRRMGIAQGIWVEDPVWSNIKQIGEEHGVRVHS